MHHTFQSHDVVHADILTDSIYIYIVLHAWLRKMPPVRCQVRSHYIKLCWLNMSGGTLWNKHQKIWIEGPWGLFDIMHANGICTVGLFVQVSIYVLSYRGQVCFQGPIDNLVSIVSGSGLPPNRRQAMTCPIIYASPGLSELNITGTDTEHHGRVPPNLNSMCDSG